MSVFTTPTRPRGSSRPAPSVPRPRGGPSLTITVDLASGTVTPRLARLVELLGELAETGEGVVRVVGADRPAPTEASDPPAVRPEPALPQARPEPALPERRGPQPAAVDPELLVLSVVARDARRGGRVVGLTRIEFDLLLFLAAHPRRVFTRGQLLAGVWGHEHSVTRTVDVHVRRLRAKLGPETPLVTTVHGVGYRLADDARVRIDRGQ